AERHVARGAGARSGRLLADLWQRLTEPAAIRSELVRQPLLLRIAQDGGDAGRRDVDVGVVGAPLHHVVQLAGRVLERAGNDLLVHQVDSVLLAEAASRLDAALAVRVVTVEERDLRVALLL